MPDLRHAAAAALLLGLCSSCAPLGGERTLELIREYPRAQASSARNPIEVFSIGDASVDGVSRRAILVRPPGRLRWRVTAGPAARLRAFVALTESSRGAPGNGALFRVLAGDAGHYEELFNRPVNARRFPQDRAWISIDVDLSRFSGRDVDVLLDVDPRGEGPVVALWGEPRMEHAAIPGS